MSQICVCVALPMETCDHAPVWQAMETIKISNALVMVIITPNKDNRFSTKSISKNVRGQETSLPTINVLSGRCQFHRSRS